MHLFACFLLLVLQLFASQGLVNGDTSTNGLRILFVNDLNYRFYPVNELDGKKCQDTHDSACVAGLGRLVSQLKNETSVETFSNGTGSQIIWLDAGNTLGKSSEWFDLMKFQPAINAMNSLNFSAVAIGSEVFQYGREAASNYISSLKGVGFAINVNSTDGKEPPFNGALTKSKTFEQANLKVTVIGFLDKDGMREKDITGLTIYDEIHAIENFINESKSKNEENHIFIAIGSVKTLSEAEKIAKIKGLNIFIFSGANITGDNCVNGTYLKEVPGINNWLVSTLPPKANESHHLLGDLSVVLSKTGILNVSLISHDYKTINQIEDSKISEIETEGLKRLNSIKYDALGNSRVSLGGNATCLMRECLLGDLITDAMMSLYDYSGNTSVDAAIWCPMPSFKSEPIKANANFTEEDLHKAIGFPDESIYTVTVPLGKLIAYLENALTSSKPKNQSFVQLSGLYVTHTVTNDKKVKIKSMSYVNSDMKLQYLDLTSEVNITIALPAHLLYNKTGLGNFDTAKDKGVTVVAALTDYIRMTDPGAGTLRLPTLGLRYATAPEEPGPHLVCMDNTAEAVLLTLTVVVSIFAFALLFWYVLLPRMRARRGSTIPLIY